MFPLQHLRGSVIKAAHSLKQQGCPAWEEGMGWGGLCNPSSPAVPVDALLLCEALLGEEWHQGGDPGNDSEPQTGFSG